MFLGIPLNIDDERLKPLRNESDTSVIKQFHRLIVGMTEPSYNRKLMRNRLNYAADPPAAFKQQAALFYTLEQNKHAVSYTWLSALPPNDTSLKVLQVIWHQE